MPVLKNAKHEAYAQGLAKGLTSDAAYKRAGYKANRGNAARLKAIESIQRRVHELQSSIAEKAEWDAARRLKTLSDIARRMETKDPRVTISAIAEANRMQGSYAPTKNEHTGKDGGPIEHVDLSKVSDADLDKLEEIYGRAAGSGRDAPGNPGGEG